MMAFERELGAEAIEAADVDVEAVEIEGTVYRRVLRREQEYLTAAGPVTVMRTLYKDHTDEGSRAIVPLELRVGIVEGYWTPLAASAPRPSFPAKCARKASSGKWTPGKAARAAARGPAIASAKWTPGCGGLFRASCNSAAARAEA